MAQAGGHPDRFGRYVVERQLGKGAMGVVYLARDPAIDRQVAVKVLHSQEGLDAKESEMRRGRFEREIRSAGTLQHPNIVTVYDVGQEGDHAFLAMEYVRGESLESLLRSGRDLNFQQISDLATRVGSGLDYAHERSIVHRDIKPGNILLTPDGEPKITDFGVAKLTNLELTATGMIIGTPMYMAPEQITGREVGPATDQWALAVVLFEILTGERPFEGDNPTTVMYRVVHDDPQPPRSLNSELPAALDSVLLKALAKDPTKRYANCTDFAEALTGALFNLLRAATDPDVPLQDLSEGSTAIFERVDLEVDKPVQVRKDPPAEKRPRKSRAGLIVALGVVALLAALGAWGWKAGWIGGPASWSGTLEVVSSHPGVDVWVTGADSGLETPAFVPLSGLEGDVVDVELRRDGEVLAATSLVLGDTIPARWASEVPPPPERLTLNSEPPGAAVDLDGSAVGSTPVVVSLVPGESHSLSLSLDGFETLERTVALDEIDGAARAAGELSWTLRPLVQPGFVQARAGYPVTFEVNGRRTRGPRLSLPPGRHQVAVAAPDVFFSTRRTVAIRSGETVELALPEAVEITVAATPSNCQVAVDGRDVGFVPAQIRVAVGTHEFTFRWQGIAEEVRVTEEVGPSTRRIFQAAPSS